MANADTFLVIDTETTIRNHVGDFGAVVTNRKGEILASCAVLVREFYLDKENNTLFHDQSADPLWGKANLDRRYAAYDAMLSDGRRMLASVPAINRWLAKVNGKYNPIVTAYNWAFDKNKLGNSGIDVEMFDRSFCLWHVAANKYAKSKAYRQFVLDTVGFNTPTKHGNMSYHTNAEIMARFVLNNPLLDDEPHTAFEDVRDYELPILKAILKNTRTKELFDVPAYNWRDYQVKDWFRPK
jgi:hypothetical protein